MQSIYITDSVWFWLEMVAEKAEEVGPQRRALAKEDGRVRGQRRSIACCEPCHDLTPLGAFKRVSRCVRRCATQKTRIQSPKDFALRSLI